MCGEKGESVGHLVSECKMLAQKEYKSRHDNGAGIVHWELCGEYSLERSKKWYDCVTEGQDHYVYTIRSAVLWLGRSSVAEKPYLKHI